MTLTLLPATAWAAEPGDTTDPPGTSTPVPTEATEPEPEPKPAPEPDRTPEPEAEATLAASSDSDNQIHLVDGTIQGQIFANLTGKNEPVGETLDVAVYAKDKPNTALDTCKTDAQGVSTLIQEGGFANGSYTLVFTGNLYMDYTKEITVSADGGYYISEILLDVVGS